MSIINAAIQSPTRLNAAGWFGFKVIFVLAAIFLLSLATVSLETRIGILPLDHAIAWGFSGE
jgi:hypothetical protein